MKAVSKKGKDQLVVHYNDINKIPVTTIDGVAYGELSNYIVDKKVYLFVNVATKWGLTDKNYKQLVQIHADYKDRGLEILAFPCN